LPGYPIISAQRGPEPIARRMPFWELPTPALADRGIVIVSGMANVSCEERFRGARPHLHAQESFGPRWAEYENTPSAGSPDGDPIARGRRPRKNRHCISGPAPTSWGQWLTRLHAERRSNFHHEQGAGGQQASAARTMSLMSFMSLPMVIMNSSPPGSPPPLLSQSHFLRAVHRTLV